MTTERSEEYLRSMAQEAARLAMASAFSAAGYNTSDTVSMQRWVEDLRWLSEQRKIAESNSEHKFRRSLVMLGAALTFAMGTVGTLFIQWITTTVLHGQK